MHTLMVLAGGLILFGLCLFVGRATGGRAGMARAALAFIPLWLVIAAVNLWVGVSRAGYTVAEETPIFLLLFGPPAAFAYVLYRRWRG